MLGVLLQRLEAPREAKPPRSLAEAMSHHVAILRKLAPGLTTAQDCVMALDALQLAVNRGELVPEASSA